MESLDYVRLFAGILSAANFVLLFVRLLTAWKLMAGGQRLLFVYITCSCVVTTWSSFDLLYGHGRSTPRHIVLLIGSLALFAYLSEPTRKWIVRMGLDPFDGINFRDIKSVKKHTPGT